MTRSKRSAANSGLGTRGLRSNEITSLARTAFVKVRDCHYAAAPDLVSRARPSSCSHHDSTGEAKQDDGAAPESNRPSRGLHDRTGFEDPLGHQAPPLRSERTELLVVREVVRRRATLSVATPRFARRPASPAAASSVAPIEHRYRRSLRPCLATPIAAPATSAVPPNPPATCRPRGSASPSRRVRTSDPAPPRRPTGQECLARSRVPHASFRDPSPRRTSRQVHPLRLRRR